MNLSYRFLKLAIIIILTLLLIACQSKEPQSSQFSSSDDSMTYSDFYGLSTNLPNISYIPKRPVFLESQNDNIPAGLGVERETDYSGITVYTQYSEYDTDTEIICYYVRNDNEGKGFWLYNCSHIERYDGEKWDLLPFAGEEVLIDFEWSFCYGKNKDGLVEATRSFNTTILAEKLVPGDYRIVAYVADEVICAEFKVK